MASLFMTIDSDDESKKPEKTTAEADDMIQLGHQVVFSSMAVPKQGSTQ
jgi:hypothetical protein